MEQFRLSDGRTVLRGQSFIANGRQYPMNWLELATAGDLSEHNIQAETVDDPAPTREELQQRINQERDRRLRTFKFGNVVYDFDTVSANRIDKARGSALAAVIAGAQPNDLRWADPNVDFGWIAADNTMHTMDAQTTLAFGNAAAAWEGLHIIAARTLKDMTNIPGDYANDSYWPAG